MTLAFPLWKSQLTLTVVSQQEPRTGHFLQLLAGTDHSLSIPRTVLVPTAMELEQGGMFGSVG